MTKLGNDLSLVEAGGMTIVPGARYTSREFFDLEMERLWPRVWQIACRAEEIPNPGDFLEYTIGNDSILVVRQDRGAIKAFHNACTHRGTRLADGRGNFATSAIRCRYHAWRFGLDGEIIEVVDREDFPATMTDEDVHLGEVQVGTWGGWVFVNMDATAESLESFLGDIPSRFASYRFEDLRFRSYRTILFDCNWKTCIDSFQEAYHPQGLHPQTLVWLDDTSYTYEQIGRHSTYATPRRRTLGPSPRLGLGPDDFDEQELLTNRIDAMSGLFSREDRARLEDLKRNGPPPGKTAVDVFDELRLKSLRDRGFDLGGVDVDEVLGGRVLHLFPSLVGPIQHGGVTQYRIRPYGLDPNKTILDYWALEWPTAGTEVPPVERKFYPDWTTKDWGTINNQDFENFVHITAGMKSRGYAGGRLNPVQEANLIHHQRTLDEYLADN